MFSDMKERVAIITGGAGGIGKQTAIRLAELGAKICITDVSGRAIAEALAEFQTLGMDAIGVESDVTDRKSVASMVARCTAAFGSVHILVNCAGIYQDCWFMDMTSEQWDRTIRINLNGVFNCCKEVADIMIRNGYGKIVSLTSQAGISGSVMHAHYAASKAGVVGLTCTLARELAQYGIHVNCVAPGIITTGMVDNALKTRSEEFLRNIPLGRFGTPDEAAKVIAFLASDDASYMTGQTINVTGGWLLHS